MREQDKRGQTHGAGQMVDGRIDADKCVEVAQSFGRVTKISHVRQDVDDLTVAGVPAQVVAARLLSAGKWLGSSSKAAP